MNDGYKKTKPHKRKQNENKVKPHWFVILSICMMLWTVVIVLFFIINFGIYS